MVTTKKHARARVSTSEHVTGKSEDSLYKVSPGYSHPLGSTPDQDGVNFSLFADYATSVELLLFTNHDDPEPFLTVELDPQVHRTFRFWHVHIGGIQAGTHYAYRVGGIDDVHGRGTRYNRNKILIDPYAKGNNDALWDRVAACGPEDNLTTSMRSVVIDTTKYDWEGDKPLNRPMSETIVYEAHVRGYTQSPSAKAMYPGTFAGVIEKIPYLQALGITAIELNPVFDFDQKEIKHIDANGNPLVNYWGYDPHSYFAPQNSYCVYPELGLHITEFRDMVKALHKANIEVILDVVFNHTGEGDQRGPTISFRGLANDCYYMLSSQDRQYYMNYSGCGNTVNGNHPITAKLIVEALQFWVTEMHIDGFRFDEASILSRDGSGVPMAYPPVIWQIELSEILADTKVIAEAWDAAGLYQIGYFPGYRWAEWNGPYRDAIRRFVKGDQGYTNGQTVVGKAASVIAGSADIFQMNGELPINSINFVTAHDGFTLNDLVSYNSKHNEGNGEGNSDGIDDNLSWNCGVEGETDLAEVNNFRSQQVKNFCAILMISQGVPMFVAGDEVRRTQGGNNNTYCQDNEVNWFDWTLTEKHSDVLRFFQKMTHFRRSMPSLQRNKFFAGEVNQRGLPDIGWHGCQLNSPGWLDPNCRVLGLTLGSMAPQGSPEDTDIFVILNMDWLDLDFELPSLTDRQWKRVVDTSQPSPQDFLERDEEIVITGKSYRANSHSVVVLVSR
jgi:isoamylase